MKGLAAGAAGVYRRVVHFGGTPCVTAKYANRAASRSPEVLASGESNWTGARCLWPLTSEDAGKRPRVHSEFINTLFRLRARPLGAQVASMWRAASLWLVREVRGVTEQLSTRGPAPGPRGR